jgi:hypothetical protein
MTVKDTGRITCSCMDSRTNCARMNCVCKHACFLVYRVLKSLDLGFLRNRILSPDVVELARVYGIERSLGELDDELDDLIGRVKKISIRPTKKDTYDFGVVKRLGEECPICYCEFVEGLEVIGCPDCGNGVHRDCMKRWIASAPKKTCVFCRSNVFTHWHF